MISLALHTIHNGLNTHLKEVLQLQKETVVMHTLSEGKNNPLDANNLALTTVNIEVENNRTTNSPYIKRDGGIAKQYPPINLNIYILISACFKTEQYLEGLHWLSEAIGFFQNKPVFDARNTPGLPPEIDKLTMELVNVDIQQQGHFWAALSGKYMPSVIYKMRQVTITENKMKAILPTVQKIIPNLIKK
ncbi:DUF4255 domain-containing protein [Flavivirga jejuensis]|uniref:DUF4255 domain-containing protein n=1 Tax=Flavivirga jejuensis TaxID=870487 RepID=A0ABT8WP07_9FLAO|nr:DUF4255 domain-containing protein [Flavivirga jejuensis]MDO5974913.1 DUF4255 domain-containing protein [Flavivirga jejuensis]